MGCGIFEDRKRFSLLLIGCSLIAVLFQSVGFFTLWWIRLTNYKVDIDIGLWSAEACHQDGKYKCQSYSWNELTELFKADSTAEKFAIDFYIAESHKSRGLASVACIATVVGILTTIVVCINPTRFFCTVQVRRLICCLAWLASSVFMLSAVICSSQFNDVLTMSAQYSKAIGNDEGETLFPWSLLLSGFGMVFSGVCCSLVAYLMCFKNFSASTDEQTEQSVMFQQSRTVF